MFRNALIVDSPARDFLGSVAAVRCGKRAFRVDTLLQQFVALEAGRVDAHSVLKLRGFMRSAFMLYLSLRNLACPRSKRPEDLLGQLPLSRAERRLLASAGLTLGAESKLSHAAELQASATWNHDIQHPQPK
jgi:hypothetical protein